MPIVQRKTGTNTSPATTLVITFDSTPTSTRTLVAVVGTPLSAASPVSSITSTGATWSRDVISKYTGPNYAAGGSAEIWRATNISSPGATVTINLASSTLAEGEILELSSLTATPTDKTATATGDDGGL